MRHALVGALALTCAGPALAGNVLVVDAANGPFFQIHAAVTAAVDGDTILVESGAYETFAVHDKALAIVGDAGAVVDVSGGVRVRRLAVGKTLVLSNLRIFGLPGSVRHDQHALHVDACDGHLRIQSCTLTGRDAIPCQSWFWAYGADAARVEASIDVTFMRSVLVGGRGAVGVTGHQGVSGAGVRATASGIAVFQSTVAGGESLTCCDGSDCGSGVELYGGSDLYAHTTAASGANGGMGTCPPCSWGGSGGSGVLARDVGTLARICDCALTFGIGGDGYPNFGCQDVDGGDGRPVFVYGSATSESIGGPGRMLEAPGIVRTGTFPVLTVRGAPGDEVWVRVNRSPTRQWQSELSGMLMVDVPAASNVLFAGTIESSGAIGVVLPVPPLPSGDLTTVLHAQAIVRRPDGAMVLGAPAAIVVVDAAY